MHKKNSLLKHLKFGFVFMLLSYYFSFAQAALYIEQYPKQTKEDELVYFTLKGENYNLEQVNIAWTVDGVLQDEGVGRTTFKYKAPKLNKQNKIMAVVDSPGLEQPFVSIVLETTPYVLLYEGKDSYVPPFYKGRALPAKEGQARLGIISFQEKNRVNWKINNDTLKSAENLIILNTKLTDNKLKIEAEIYHQENLKATLAKDIDLKKPEVYLHTKDMNTGGYRQTLGNEEGGEINIKVEPYYISAANKKDPNLRLVWNINDIKQTVKDPWFVKFTSSKKENVAVKLEIRQTEKITQRISKVFNINFK